MASVREPETEKPPANGSSWWHIATRIFLLTLGGVSLYLLAPKLISVLGSWPQLKTLKPAEFGLALLFEAMSYLSLWSMQRVALHTTSWFAVGTTQLASGAIGSVVPGGAATAGAAAYGMLTTDDHGSVADANILAFSERVHGRQRALRRCGCIEHDR